MGKVYGMVREDGRERRGNGEKERKRGGRRESKGR